MVTGLRGLRSRLLEVREYLEAVSQGRLPVNHDILRNLQARPAGGWGGEGKTGRYQLRRMGGRGAAVAGVAGRSAGAA